MKMRVPREVERLLSHDEYVESVFNDLELWDDDFDIYLTTKRLVFLRQTGFVFKKTRTYSIKFSEIEDIWYTEKGLLRKTGILVIKARKRKWVIKGDPEDVSELYKVVDERVG